MNNLTMEQIECLMESNVQFIQEKKSIPKGMKGYIVYTYKYYVELQQTFL